MENVDTETGFIVFRWLRRLYHWVLRWSDHRHNTKALGVIAFTEASFFPIPPDPLLMTMGASKPKKALHYALITTLSSVAGGLFGYLVGFLFWEATQGLFYQFVFSEEMFMLVVEKFKENTFFSIFLASFTPIPFKVFTVAGGVASVPLVPFILASLLGRGLRFAIVGGLIYFFGKPIMGFVERHFENLTILFSILLVGGFLSFKYIL